jgi:hypothetical protein
VVNWDAICFWGAIILLLDASFGLWNHDRFSKIAPKINIFKAAVIEAVVAICLMMVHYFF